MLKSDFDKATMHGHSPVNLQHNLSGHIFIRTPLEDCFQHNKRNSVNISMNHASCFISASYSVVAPRERHKWLRHKVSHFFNFLSC